MVNGGRVCTRWGHGMVSVYDAFTGRPLWRTEIPTRRWRAFAVSMNDGIYLAFDNKCIVLDPADGKLLKTSSFTLPKAQFAMGLRVTDDIILILCGLGKVFDGWGENAGCTLVCLARDTGAELWRREAKQRYHGNALAVGGGMVFCVDSISCASAMKGVDDCGQCPKIAAKLKELKELESTLLALEALTGKELWSKKILYDTTHVYTPKDYETGVADAAIGTRLKSPTGCATPPKPRRCCPDGFSRAAPGRRRAERPVGKGRRFMGMRRSSSAARRWSCQAATAGFMTCSPANR